MVTIENQLKKLQQCLSSTTSHSASMAGSTSAVSGGTMGISSSTGNSAASENEVICIREAETSEQDHILAPNSDDKTMQIQLMQKTDQDQCTDTDNNSTTDENS